jgi:Carboxypeptidase regulatory-like domain
MRAIRFIPIMLALLLYGGIAQAQGDSERWLLVEVKDASGEPLKRACVTVVPKEGEIVFRNADSRGRVKLKKPAPGNYRVVVKVDGYEAQKREVVIGSGDETVAFTLQPRENR